jgi:ABC-type branched-subunit amino acid transport system ATPase component
MKTIVGEMAAHAGDIEFDGCDATRLPTDQRVRLGVAGARRLRPPTEGVWIGVIEEIAERLRALVAEMAVVLVEEHLELALSVADYAYVLDRGRLALEGPSASVRSDSPLLQYLAPRPVRPGPDPAARAQIRHHAEPC